MIKILSIAVVTTLFAIPTWAQDQLSAIHENNEAVRKLEQEDAVSAERHLLNALPEAPFDPILKLNLGLAYEMQKKYDRALNEYQGVLRINNLPEDLKFYAHFNSGNALAQLKKTDEALGQFQAALSIDPNSIETKKNIELLMRQGQGQGKGQNQQGQGQSQGENENDGQGDKEKEKPQDPNGEQKQKPEFKSQNLTKEDVRKIMEELKSQEKKIRALEHGTKGKEANPGKDW